MLEAKLLRNVFKKKMFALFLPLERTFSFEKPCGAATGGEQSSKFSRI